MPHTFLSPISIPSAGDAVSEASPQAVRVTAGHRLRRPAKSSTAASFHGVAVSRIAHFDTLTLEHPELDGPLEFCIHDPTHCALVLVSTRETAHHTFTASSFKSKLRHLCPPPEHAQSGLALTAYMLCLFQAGSSMFLLHRHSAYKERKSIAGSAGF